MSIRIVPQNEVSNNTADTIPPLLFPNVKNLYSRRADRLRELAKEHPLADYLNFAAVIADAQSQALADSPFTIDLSALLENSSGQSPLDIRTLQRDPYWQQLLNSLLNALHTTVPEHVKPVLDALSNVDQQQREELADALLTGNYAAVSSDQALFIWAALSLYWAQMASQIPGRGVTEYGEQRQFCPVCHSMPVASVVHLGSNNGLRYLHCSLCESEWHVVRIKCSNCEQSAKLNYWSLDSEQAAVKAESCGDCTSYLKILYQEKEPHLEVIADDLASLILDAKMEDEGFARSSINPYLFPEK